MVKSGQVEKLSNFRKERKLLSKNRNKKVWEIARKTLNKYDTLHAAFKTLRIIANTDNNNYM